jgi:hypothetical protein
MERFIRLLKILLIRKVAERAHQLVTEAGKSGDHRMTLFLLGREMRQVGPELSAYLLREILVRAGQRVPGFGEFVQHAGDVRALASFVGNDFMSTVLQKGRRMQMDEVTDLLASTPPQRRIYHSEDVETRTPAQDYVPLGVRKSLARKSSLQTIEALISEQDPSVVRHLLANPRVTEEMVVKMASLRPTSQAVLEEISVSQRWSPRHRIRRALVFNPYTPPRITHSLLPGLTIQDLMDISVGRSLHAHVRRSAKRIILNRMAEMGPTEKEEFNRIYSARLKQIFLRVG